MLRLRRGLADLAGRLSAALRPPVAWRPPTPIVRPPRPGAVRVVLVSHNLSPVEGAPLSLFVLARGLARIGYEPLVLAMEDGALRPSYEAEGIAVEVVNPLVGIADARAYGTYGERIERLSEWVRAAEARLILSNTLVSFWGVRLARTAGVPALWCIRESVDWRAYFRRLPSPLAEEAVASLRATDRLIFVADATRRLFAEFDDPGRTHTIHNGVDVASIDAYRRARSPASARAAHGLDDASPVVSVIGTTCERKAQLDLLRAATTLTGRGAGAPRIQVVGARPGRYLRGLKAFARKHRLERVAFVEETTEVFDYYRMSDVFVCTSHEESFPRVILEAMAFELPIVSTNVHGIPEALTDGVSALLVAPGDVEALAAGVARLLDDPALARRLARNAYTTLASRFTVEQMIKEYDRLLAGCLVR